MKLLIVTQSIDNRDPLLGFFIDWVKEFSKNFEEVNVVCLNEGYHDLPKNVTVHSLGKEKGASKLSFVFRFYRLVFGLRGKYDAVFVHMNPIYMVLAGLFWRAVGKKTAIWYTHKNVDLKLRIATFFTHRIFSASKESFRIETTKLIVTGHGIMTEKFLGGSKTQYDNIRLITIGRISKVKQTKKCVEIIEQLIRENKAKLSIVGDAAGSIDEIYKDQLVSLVQEKELAEYVTFVGSISNSEIPAILLRNDIMLHTSLTGSVDKVVLEALLSGVLVLTENESFKESLGPLGMFMDDSSVKSYCNKIIEFSQDISKAQMAINSGREWVEKNHSLKSLIPNIRKEYERLSTSR